MVVENCLKMIQDTNETFDNIASVLFGRNLLESLSPATGKIQVDEMKRDSNTTPFGEAKNKNQILVLSILPSLWELRKRSTNFNKTEIVF